MKNFIFKSPKDFHKIVFNKLETIQNEQRHARQDLSLILRQQARIITDMGLQKQVDEYFDEDVPEDTENIPEVDDERHSSSK